MSEARARLLGTASGLFYAEGLHSVGIDRIIATAGVTRATLYRHFPSKDDLVVTYLTQADEAIRTRVDAARTQNASPDDVVRTVGRFIADDIQSPGFRGARSSTRRLNTPTRRTRSTRRSSGTGSGFWPR